MLSVGSQVLHSFMNGVRADVLVVLFERTISSIRVFGQEIRGPHLKEINEGPETY